jgi:hypothetical protein
MKMILIAAALVVGSWTVTAMLPQEQDSPEGCEWVSP